MAQGERGAEIFTYESPSLVYGMNWSVSGLSAFLLGCVYLVALERAVTSTHLPPPSLHPAGSPRQGVPPRRGLLHRGLQQPSRDHLP